MSHILLNIVYLLTYISCTYVKQKQCMDMDECILCFKNGNGFRQTHIESQHAKYPAVFGILNFSDAYTYDHVYKWSQRNTFLFYIFSSLGGVNYILKYNSLFTFQLSVCYAFVLPPQFYFSFILPQQAYIKKESKHLKLWGLQQRLFQYKKVRICNPEMTESPGHFLKWKQHELCRIEGDCLTAH